jgi:hypothetical protein
MTEFRYGPVELYLVRIEGDRPDPATIAAIVELIDGGLVRLLDFILISKDEDGEVEVLEIEDDTDEFGLGEIELDAVGIAGDEDIEEFAELIPPGGAAVLVALELTWARRLAQRLSESGAEVLSHERIPAPVVNALVDAAEVEFDDEE